jgi:hypothetical protein
MDMELGSSAKPPWPRDRRWNPSSVRPCRFSFSSIHFLTSAAVHKPNLVLSEADIVVFVTRATSA